MWAEFIELLIGTACGDCKTDGSCREGLLCIRDFRSTSMISMTLQWQHKKFQLFVGSRHTYCLHLLPTSFNIVHHLPTIFVWRHQILLLRRGWVAVQIAHGHTTNLETQAVLLMRRCRNWRKKQSNLAWFQAISSYLGPSVFATLFWVGVITFVVLAFCSNPFIE
jgi:hypothetical protein